MSDQFDKKLINRINEVFENFEDDSVNEGWQQLRKKFPERGKNRKAIWWFSSAAAILLMAGIWLMYAEKYQDDKNTAKVSPKSRSENIPADSSLKKPVETSPDKYTALAETPVVKLFKPNATSKYQPKAKAAFSSKIIPGESAIIQQSERESKAEHNLTILALSSQKGSTADLQPSKGATELLSSNTTTDNKPETGNDNTVVYPAEVITKEKLSALMGTQADRPKEKTKLSIAFFAGSYFTYAEGSETSMNTGVGISSEIKISKKLKLSSGLALAQNSLKFNQNIPREAALNFAKAENNSNGIALDSYYSPLNGSLQPNINTYNARLLGFDIPINLKYSILQRKNTVYLSTGFSSNFFINESYTYDYNYKMGANSSLSSPDQESTNRFQSFDFARVLNFSVGLEHPINSKTKLSFEPFIKYPLSGLGSHDLRFGAAGMNLKFNFDR